MSTKMYATDAHLHKILKSKNLSTKQKCCLLENHEIYAHKTYMIPQ